MHNPPKVLRQWCVCSISLGITTKKNAVPSGPLSATIDFVNTFDCWNVNQKFIFVAQNSKFRCWRCPCCCWTRVACAGEHPNLCWQKPWPHPMTVDPPSVETQAASAPEPSHPQARPTPLEIGRCRRHPLPGRPGILGCKPATVATNYGSSTAKPKWHEDSIDLKRGRCFNKMKHQTFRDGSWISQDLRELKIKKKWEFMSKKTKISLLLGQKSETPGHPWGRAPGDQAAQLVEVQVLP